ncbi:MAG TPA: ATP-binding cassette domain-containing protein, partial [Verrucomicrobiae bacterium]|nr:ATP-binding cassette domain-containing protein [Verrucomicrobiae bacterium]
MSAGPQAVLRATGVGKIFDVGPNPVTALEEIDLTIRAGEFVSLIGPSGCGKTTLLRVMGDLLEPTSGEVLVNAKPARRARL